MRSRTRSVVFRGALILLAAVALGTLPWGTVAGWLPWPPAALDGERAQVGVLLLASVAAGWLTINLDQRASVSLIGLPLTLAWWQVSVPAAQLSALVGTLIGNATRRAGLTGSLAGAARLVVAATAAGAAAGAVGGSQSEVGALLPSLAELPLGALTIAEVLRAAVFVAALSAVDWLLDWVDTRLAPAGRAATERLMRTDLAFSALLFPLALVFHGTDRALGWQPQGVLLGGLFAALLVVRTWLNLRTLHQALRRLYGVVAEQRERLDTLVTHSGEAIFTIDPALRLSTANPALEQLLDRPSEALVGRACAEVCHFEDEHGTRLCPERCPLVRAHREGQPVSIDVVYQRAEQPPKHVLLTYAAVGEPDGRLRLGIGIARDVTGQREAERLREEFVSLVTHELRSPLTSSTGYLDLLKRTLERVPISAGLDTTKVLGYVDRIQGAERHLLRLVNNLLDIARVERADLPLDVGAVRVEKVAAEALDAVALQASQKKIMLMREGEGWGDALPPVWTSELYVREILGNLVSNAIKYTPEGGRVTVRLRRVPAPAAPSTEEDEAPREVVELSVTDTGYGMSEQDLSRLFGKFFRSGRPEIRKERGTGLGLALSKQMAERLGGAITVTSELGKGSTFTLRLPLTHVRAEELVTA
ncbi:MAG TPA: ATP-binding protein [Chloroflexota bacterium]|nr:ATP-binding protein [Chloroflexota bacterium]